ncbi:MAG: CPBP family intramembrane glutamic endopeptidase [bacterium]
MVVTPDAVAVRVVRLRSSTLAILIGAVSVVAASTAAWLFPRALPIVALKQSITRDIALARADSFFRAHALAPSAARTAVHFQGNDSLRTFVELAGGGADSLNALVRGRDVAPFSWAVRAFVPRDPREAHVEFAPDGRVIGFSQTLAESDKRLTITADSGQRLALLAIGGWIDDRADRWRLVSSSYETKKTSGRVDRTYTFERSDRRVGGAGIRAEVVIAGNAPSRVRQYVDIPESFRRRYGEMRSSNELLALIASMGALVIAIAGIVFVSKAAKSTGLRWREAMLVGAVIGGLTVAAGLNEMSGSWYSYDTAMSPAVFQARIAMEALLMGGLTGLLAGFTLAAAEAASRRAFPEQLDWWKLWQYRGTRDVATRVAGGYAVATIGFAYVAVFYLVTRNLLGWWVPSEMLDDPNLIATPMPWMSGIAVSLNAGVWEETLFRALPLSLLSLWVGQRPGRRWWMTGGVVATALVFGFAHANYASWPPYSRGVEIFLDACFWGVLVLNFGVLTTVVAHFVYDLVLFGLFATSGNAAEYRVSAAIILLALLTPAIAVAWRWLRQGTLTTAPPEARFGAFTSAAIEETVEVVAPRPSHGLTTRARRFAIAAVIIAAVAAVTRPPQPTLGPQFTADRAQVLSTADSILRAHGGDPVGWRRLSNTATDSLVVWPRFLRRYKLVPQAQRFAATYVPPTWWVVRYVHTGGTAAQRTEEWRIRLWPNGKPLDARHLIPDSAQRVTVLPDSVRRIALGALTRAGVNTTTLQESEFKEKALPSRHDVSITYTDTAVKLPAGAVARAWVNVAGEEPLVARRGVDLPEAFLRADREQQNTRAVVAGLCGLLLVGGTIVGAVFVTRRRPVLVQDGALNRRATLMLIGTLVVLAVLGDLNSLPSALFPYDTTEPWSSFVGTKALGLISSIPLSLVVLGLWLALDAVRRRVGIPMLGGAASRSASNDMLVAGLGLGAIVYAASRVGELVPSTSMPRVPSTLLDAAVPMLGGITGVLSTTMTMVAIVGIPMLVVGGITRKLVLRALILIGMIGLVIAAVIAVAPAGDMEPGRIALFVVMIAVVALAFHAWGAMSAWSWIVAVLAQQALVALRQVVHAPVWQERVAGGLLLVVACALIGVVARRTRVEA